jgi:GMP synthase-like glutamine amidotransferase
LSGAARTIPIIVVDNGSTHLRELVRLCGSERTQVVSAGALAHTQLPSDAVVVLSGSHERAVLSSLKYYAPELDLIAAATHPIIGICLGFELIAYAAGAELVRLNRPAQGIIEVFPTPEGENWFPAHQIPVAEGHRWVVKEPPPGYLALATSTDGIEAIGNLTRRIIGFQFHPEHSVSQTNGGAVFMNVLRRITAE